MNSRLEAQLKALPARPGVYVFRDEGGVRPVHRQGEVTPLTRAQLLPEERAAASGSGATQLVERVADVETIVTGTEVEALHLEQNLVKRHRPAVQRPAPRRQVVPVHRRDRRGRVPAGHVHARAAPARRRLLRPVRKREEGARDARRPQPRLQVPALRGAEAGPPLGHPVPRLPHRPVPGTVRRLRVRGRLRRRDRRRDRLPRRRHAHDRARAGGPDAGGCRRRALRGRRTLPQPPVLDPPPRRAAGGRPAHGRLGRRRRARRGRERGRRCRSSRSATAS